MNVVHEEGEPGDVYERQEWLVCDHRAETTAEVAARMIREERAESQRLRDLLTRARVGLEQAGIALRISGLHNDASATDFALHLSDPSREDSGEFR